MQRTCPWQPLWCRACTPSAPAGISRTAGTHAAETSTVLAHRMQSRDAGETPRSNASTAQPRCELRCSLLLRYPCVREGLQHPLHGQSIIHENALNLFICVIFWIQGRCCGAHPKVRGCKVHRSPLVLAQRCKRERWYNLHRVGKHTDGARMAFAGMCVEH